MKAVRVLARVLFVIVLPAVLLTGSIALLANTQPFYEYGFARYGVSATTGLVPEELSKAAGGLIKYFNSGEELIDLTIIKDGQPFTLFNQREVLHLKDVKGLLHLDYRVFWAGLAYVLAYTAVLIRKRERRELAKAGLGGAAWTLVIMLALGIGSLFNFGQLFLQFHFLSFANDLWRLDPARDYMIMLFPEGFFFDFVLTVGGASLGIAIAVGIVSWRWLRKNGFGADSRSNIQDRLNTARRL